MPRSSVSDAEMHTKSKVNDLFPDCPGPVADDEPELALHPANGTFRCGSGELPCLMFYSKCYPVELYCVYDLDADGNLYPCRNSGHLHDCRLVHCPGRYKCSESYCIATQRVCDGTSDCPDGQDEMYCENMTCPGLLKCKESGLCVDRRNIHNNRTECTGSNDDEMLRKEECPPLCVCVGSAVSCREMSNLSLPAIPVATKMLLLSQNSLQLESTSFLHLQSLRILDLSRNGIKYIVVNCFNFLGRLFQLDLSHNNITFLETGSFKGLESLHFLSIEGNDLHVLKTNFLSGAKLIPRLNFQNLKIHTIEDGGFLGSSSVRFLNLSHNDLLQIRPRTFEGLLQLEILDLRSNPLLFIDPRSFAELSSLLSLYTDLYRVCCMQSNITWCSASQSLVSTCTDLLRGRALKSVTWLMGGCTIFGNVWVIIQQAKILFTKKKSDLTNLHSSILFLNLAMSDLLYGLYLLGLGIADSYYDSNFMQRQDLWITSLPCAIIGILAASSLDMSLCVLACLALDQAHVIVKGFYYGYIRCHIISFSKLVTIVLCCWVALIACPLTYHLTAKMIGSGSDSETLCLATILHSAGDSSAWHYFTLVSVTCRLLVCGTIAACYIAVVKVHFDSKRAVSGLGKSKGGPTPYAKIAVIIFTNVTVSITYCVTALLNVLGRNPDGHVMLWLVIFILPLNACINPYIYNWRHLVDNLLLCVGRLRTDRRKGLMRKE